jgi:hypothetical protein
MEDNPQWPKGSTSLTASSRSGDDPRWLKDQLTAMFMVFPASSQLTPKDYAARLLAYMEDLGEYPKEILSGAIREARRGAQTFCPSIKDIRDAADRSRRDSLPRGRAYAPEPEPVPPPGGYCTPEQAAAVLKKFRRDHRMPEAGEMTQSEFDRRKAKMLEEIDQWMRDRGHDWPPPKTAA